MATTAQRLIIDTEGGRLVGAFGPIAGVTQPSFVIGDSCPIELYLVRQPGVGQPLVSVPFPAGAVVRCAVGVVNTQPTSGSWSVTFDGDTATGLAFDISAQELEDALNDLASITSAGGVTVDKVGGQYRVSFVADGSRPAFTAGSNTLVPASDLQVTTLQEGGASTKEVVMLNLAVRPISLTSTFTDLPALGSSYTATGWSITGRVRSGSYRLQVTFEQDGDTSTVWTDSILYGSNTTQISQAIFNALVNAQWGNIQNNPTTNAWGLTTTELGDGGWRVDFTAPQFQTSVPVVSPTIVGIDITQLSPMPGKVGSLGLNTVEAVAFLDTQDSRRAVLEIEVEADGEIQTLLQTPCNVLGQVIYEGTFAPIPYDTPLTETVANARYVRRDAAQSPTAGELDVIWPNLGVSHDGSDVAAAISGASAPAAGNVFVTASQLPNQSLNTTDSVTFVSISSGGGVVINGGIDAGGNDIFGVNALTFGDATTQSTAYPGFDQSLNTTDSVTFDQLTSTQYIVANGGVLCAAGSVNLADPAGRIIYPDATEQESAPVYSAGTGQSGGSGSTIHNGDYPDEITIVIGGVTYAMPARIV